MGQKTPVKKILRPRITEDEYQLLLGIREQCKEQGIGLEYVPDGWLKGKRSSLRFKNPLYKNPQQKTKALDFQEALGFIEPVSLSDKPKVEEGIFDRVVYTDVHIGMDVNPSMKALYGGKWDGDELLSRLDRMVDFIVSERKSPILYIDELGDFMDGLDGETVRKGHKLPQNMTNQEAFNYGLRFKVSLIEALAPYYERIIARNICDDNHAGDFGYFVNQSAKVVLEAKLPEKKVEIINQIKFMGYYTHGKYGFICTHGKDGENLKYGLKPQIKPQEIKRIEQYMNHNRLSADIIWEFSKGDSHQELFDNCSSNRFRYFNYPAFSPASNWVQTNFTPQHQGFFLFNYYAQRARSIHPFYF